MTWPRDWTPVFQAIGEHSNCLANGQMNVQHSLIWEFMFYKFKLGQNNTHKQPKTFVEQKAKVQLITRWLKKFCLAWKNIDDQVVLDRLKTIDSEAMLQAIESNLASNNKRISGELGFSQSRVVCHLHNISKSIWSYLIVPHITKILQNFWLTPGCWKALGQTKNGNGEESDYSSYSLGSLTHLTNPFTSFFYPYKKKKKRKQSWCKS